MPASLYYEKKVLNQLLKEEAFTATKLFMGLTTLKPSTFLKSTTGTEAWNAEPSEGSGKNGWARIEVGVAAKPGWTVTETGGATGFTIYENTNAIKTGTEAFEWKKTSGGSFLCETFCICDALTAGNVLAFGTITVPPTITSATTLETAAKALKFELE